jgi:hypothetical protein
VVVTADGFAPGSEVDITLHSSPLLLGHATTDATGAFVRAVTVPEGTSATLHHVVVTGTDPSGAAVTYTLELRVTEALPQTSTLEAVDDPGNGSPARGLALIALGATLGALFAANRRRRPVID